MVSSALERSCHYCLYMTKDMGLRPVVVLIPFAGEDDCPMMAVVHKVFKVVSGLEDDDIQCEGAENALLEVTWLYRQKEVVAKKKKPSQCKVGAELNGKKEPGAVREVSAT